MAAECFALSRQVQDPEQAAKLLHMAQAWNEMAERADKTEAEKSKE
jgi:hypothetical protein